MSDPPRQPPTAVGNDTNEPTRTVEPAGPLGWLVRSVQGVLLGGVNLAIQLVSGIILAFVQGFFGAQSKPKTDGPVRGQTTSHQSANPRGHGDTDSVPPPTSDGAP